MRRFRLAATAAISAALVFGFTIIGLSSSAHAHQKTPAALLHATLTDDTTANCTLVVPATPLSAAGLATPYQLTAPAPGSACSEGNANSAAFVQADLINPSTGQISVYNPLAIAGLQAG